MSGYLSSIYNGLYYLVWGESDVQKLHESPPCIEKIVFLGSDKEEDEPWILLTVEGEEDSVHSLTSTKEPHEQVAFFVTARSLMENGHPSPFLERSVALLDSHDFYEIDSQLRCKHADLFFVCLNHHFERLKLHDELGSGVISRVWHFTYRGGEGVLRISRTDALHECAIRNYFTLSEKRGGGEFYALAQFNSPHVLHTESAICWEEPAEHFRVITQEEVMFYIQNPSKLSGRSFTFYASISEYIPGAKDLQKCIDEEEEFSPTRIVDIAQQILQGMADVRRVVPGLMHRDLKPANLLVTPKGQIKILDFGFSKQREPVGLEKFVCGSPLFMAPQIAICEPYDETCDNYSIFTILFKLATKDHYLNAPNTYEFYRIVQEVIRIRKNPRNSLRLRQVEPLLLRELIASLGQINPAERASFEQALWLAHLIKRLHFPPKALTYPPEIELFSE